VHYFVITEEICEQAISRIFVSRLIEIFSLPLNLVLPRRSSMATYNSLLCQSIPRVQMRFFGSVYVHFQTGYTAKTQQLASFLFHQSLAISEFLPPECYENDFLCWKSSQNYILSCCNLKKPVIVFCLSPQNPPTRELQMLCFKNSQRVFIKCFDSNGFY